MINNYYFFSRSGDVFAFIHKGQYSIKVAFCTTPYHTKCSPYFCYRLFSGIIYNMKRDTKKKILLLLLAGVSLSLSKSPRGYFKIIKGLPEGLKEIKRKRLRGLIREFYNDRLVSYKENNEGLTEIVLTKDGEKKALKFKLDDMRSEERRVGK